MDPITVKPVAGRKMLETFIRVPWPIYRDDPRWVPPLILERRQFLSPQNPYFEHAQFQSWIAFRGAVPVGRISAQIDRLHLERYNDHTGFWGMLEAQNDPAIFQALFATAETWLHKRGIQRILGPFNLSINHEIGLLVEGFDTPPMVMMGHALPYYAQQLAPLGYTKVKDVLAYIASTDLTITPGMQAVIRHYDQRIAIRFFDFKRIAEDLEILRSVFEDAWSENWSFLPFTPEELRHMGQDLKLFVPKEFAAIADFDGEPAAIFVVFPDLNEAIQDLNGRLLPLGWAKLLWRLKRPALNNLRVPLMGVRKRYHNSRLAAALALSLIDRVGQVARSKGYQQVEMSWILEDNTRMRNMIESLGGRVYKRYRMYEKQLP